MNEQLDFCTLGMFIIDEIDYLDHKSRQDCIIGGAGTFAAIGARLVARSPASVSWIVDVGRDFPPAFRSTIESWQTTCVFRVDQERLTTRAWNGYGKDEYRGFRYLTPKIRLDHDSLSRSQIMAKAFHIVCSSDRCMSLANGIMLRRGELVSALEASKREQRRPLLVWEPVPELCVPVELAKFKEAIRNVDIVSPNAEELAGFFTSRHPVPSESQVAKEILGWGIGPLQKGALVVRQGKEGSAAYCPTGYFHLRPYYLTAAKVVDPTGAGNTFLGAFAQALDGNVNPPASIIETALVDAVARVSRDAWESMRRLLHASIYATVAASFVIEQPGMPLLERANSGKEYWNGESFEDRLITYLTREKDYIARHLSIEPPFSS